MGNNKVNDERNGFVVRPARLRSPRMFSGGFHQRSNSTIFDSGFEGVHDRDVIVDRWDGSRDDQIDIASDYERAEAWV